VNDKEQLPPVYGSISEDMSNSVPENYNENYMNRFSCSGFPTNSRGRCSLRRRFEIYWCRCTV